MDTALSQQSLEEMLDTVVREVTETTAGIRLYHDTQPPAGELCTIYITFQKACTPVYPCARKPPC